MQILARSDNASLEMKRNWGGPHPAVDKIRLRQTKKKKK